MSSALDVERARASFNADALTNIIYSPKSLAFKREFEAVLKADPLFDKTDDYFLSREDYVKKCVNRSFETYRLLKANKNLLAQHSPLHGEGGAYVGALGTPSGLTDHFSLFVGTLLTQATPEQQRKWVMPSVNLQIIGTYAQTELGHGSNVRGLETTATYEETTDSFIMDSPTVSSAKWWPGALGLLATHAVMYARLIIKEKDYGFHAFMVQLRDENLRPLPGVEVGDLGPKLGYGAYDSGFLRVTKMRIPRFNMLARFQRVEKGGAYKKAPAALQKIAYLTMLKTRVFIAHHSAFGLAKILTIATRYAAARKQGFIDGKKGGAENVILDYSVIQDRLMPQIATAFAMHFAGAALQEMCKTFEATLQAAKTEDALNNIDASILPALHATSSGMKAFLTQMGLNGMEEARKCCGGHGYTLNSGMGLFIWTLLPSITYEGDMVPMALQTGRYLLKCANDVRKGKVLHPMFAYLGQKDNASAMPESEADFADLGKLLEVYRRASRSATLAAVTAVMRAVQENGDTPDNAMIRSHIEMYRAAQAHTMTILLTHFVASAEKLTNAPIQAVMKRLAAVFGIDALKYLVPLCITLTPQQAKAAAKAKHTLLGALRPEAISLVDAFDFTDFELATTIGNRQNADMYERMVAAARRNPLNSSDYMRTFHSELLASRLNKTFLAGKKVAAKL